MLNILIILVFLVVTAGLLYLSSIDGDYQVRRSCRVNAGIDTVFDKVRDFRTWPEWSPWLMHEPECRLEYSDNCTEEGGYYSWDGKYLGAGKLTHVKFERPHRIHQKIEFFRPFKSTCEVGFTFTDYGGETEVAWNMHGHMPFLLRFMIVNMVSMIERDYDLGLAMLAGQLDPASEFPRISFQGKTILEPEHCLCEKFNGFIREMEIAMKNGFPQLLEYIREHNGRITGKPFTAYHKVNLTTMHFCCDMAVPVAGGIDPGNYSIKTLGGGNYFKVTLQGNYDFLESAWYSAYAHMKMHSIKTDKKRPALEIYENNLNTVSTSNDLLTTLCIPLR